MGKPMDRTAQSLWFFVLFFLAGHSCATAADGLAREPRPSSWKADASLTDVTFVDRQRGWAVGSHGVLLRTEDGGKTWGEGNLASSTQKPKEAPLTEKIRGIRARHQMGITHDSGASNFSCRFESVCFTDEKNGWAAGGYDLPWLNHSRAVIARTLDGGKSWQSLPHLMIGRIQKIDFRGMQLHSGWAVGASDPATDASLFFTADAGNIWSSQKSERMPNLVAAETAGNRFVGIDSQGQPVNFDTVKLEHSVIMEEGDYFFTDVAMVDAKDGYAVGSNGAFMRTKNAGLSWSNTTETQVGEFDFRCVHNTGKKVWFAGDPGHLLFSYDPVTGDLQSHPLPGSVGINAIHFVDGAYGWAVGDLGKIWHTQDGGNTWKLQRSSSHRSTSHVGMLVVCRNESELPLEFIARHAGEDGKLVGVVMPQSASNDSARLAVERVGAAVVSVLPTRSDDELLRKTVRTIRQWRPSIIVGEDRQFLEQAIRMSTDEGAFPTQLATEMKPWQPEFMMVADPNGPIKYENSIFMPRTGSLLEDFVLPSRMLCGFSVASRNEQNKSAFFAWKSAGNGRGVRLTEINTSPFLQTSVAKRKQGSIPPGSLSSVQRIGQKREQLKWLLNQEIESILDVEECKRRIGQLAFQFNATPNGKHLAGVWLLQLADQFIQAGKHQQAAFALEELARSNSKHCFAPLAAATLVRYYSSSELNDQALNRWKQLRSNIGQASRIPDGLKSGPGNVAIEQSKVGQGRTEYRWNKVDLASALEEAAAIPLDFDVEEELENFDPATVDLSLEIEEETESPDEKPAVTAMSSIESDTFLRQRLRSAANQFSRLAMRDPGLVKRADFLFWQAHIVKGLGGIEEAKPYYQNILKAKPLAEFSLSAKSEVLSDKKDYAKTVIATDQRPHLDGLPNDPVWQEVIGAGQTLNVEATQPTPISDVALVAHDREYIYLYAKCYKSKRTYREDSGEPRKRDADLSNHDRVEFCFDVDRDLVSSWKVQINWQGRVCESCGEDKSWNPEMFVARHVDDRVWSIECAIPIKDLSRPVKEGSTWRLNVRRMFGTDRGSMNFWGPSRQSVGQLVEFQ